MKMPRDVSGQRLADHLCRHWDFERVGQVGSHIMLRTDTPERKKVVVPEHHPLRTGTLSAILRQVADHKGVTREDILRDL
jgi:predicted RNA binding protein YcfA (HicA-like mRNA interferase family)